MDNVTFLSFFLFLHYKMGKAKRDQQKKTTPYSRPTTIKKKPITKAEKLKNKSITEDLDKNIEELTQQLRPKKKKQIQIRNDDMDNVSCIGKNIKT